MSFLESMQQRYTTKQYDASKRLADQQVDALKEILRLSPSSINSQPWKFTFIRSEASKQKLADISWLNKEKVLQCDTVVVFSRSNDIPAFEERIEKELPEGAVGFYKEFVQPLGPDHIKAWFSRQVYLAMGVFLSACAEMKIDSTPIEGLEPASYDQVMQQTDYTTLAAVAIGYRDPRDFNQPTKKAKSRRALDSVIDML